MSRAAVAVLLLTAVVPVRGADDPAFDAATLEFFEKDVRPILVARCLACHGPGERAPKGGLRLVSRAAVLKGGDTGAAAVSGKPAESLLVSAINYGDVYQMPPKAKLPAGEIAVLTRWVELGLPWPQEKVDVGTARPFDLAARRAAHWCWQPVVDHAPPPVKDDAWPLATADRFILSKLEAHGLKPAPPADRRVLLRRVYFDLIGLPPTPAETDEFVRDESPRALETVVDRLLGSVHFGERWGRHWLDLVRFAESRGHEFDPSIPNAWQYRDYVIRALNADVPYDRFVAEHVAGDLLDPRWREDGVDPTRVTSSGSARPAINEAPLGTGFWFLGEEVHSPVDLNKDETDRVDNRLDVLSKAFLGLTVACARCHDHKFDAISQRDYYALAGYVLSGGYRQIRVDTAEQHRAIAAKLQVLRQARRREIAGELLKAASPVLKDLDRYLSLGVRILEAGARIDRPEGGPNRLAAESRTKADALAAETRLDPEVLARWIVELDGARTEVAHPLHGLFASPVARAEPARSEPMADDSASLVVDFARLPAAEVRQDGVSFGTVPVRPGRLAWRGPPEGPELFVETIGGWERDLFWRGMTLASGTEDDHGKLGPWHRHGRAVRSPEFTLTGGKLWYLVRGSVRAYAAVNSHLLINGPLHGGLLLESKGDQSNWRWVPHALEGYRGHRLHVEFFPMDEAECRIARVVQQDSAPLLPEASWSWLHRFVKAESPLPERAAAYGQAIEKAVANLAGEGESAESPDRAAWADVANWFVHRLELFTISLPGEALTGAVSPASSLAARLAAVDPAETTLAALVTHVSGLAPTMLENNGVDVPLLIRGNSATPRDPVPRRFLEAFGPEFGSSGEPGVSAPGSGPPDGNGATHPLRAREGTIDASGRLELATAMLKSPLASRVAVNRIWQHLFGRGLVPSVDNFGVLGVPPSHPELLDHLAARFVADGWSQKKLIKSLVLSQTYRMASRSDEAADVADPGNRLWHRMPVRRLEGEALRDALLAVSGRLDRRPFGPSVPVHLTEFMQGRGRPQQSGPLDGDGRRSIYLEVRRNFLSPMMLAFDTPSPFSTVGSRTVSNVPAQALILMNDPLVFALAQRWAGGLLADASRTAVERIDGLYLTALARPALPFEKAEALRFLDAQRRPDDSSGAARRTDQEVWADLCHVIFNLKEFSFIE